MSCTHSWTQSSDNQGSFFQSFWVVILVFLCEKKGKKYELYVYQESPWILSAGTFWTMRLFVFPCLCSANSPMPLFLQEENIPSTVLYSLGKVHLVCIQHHNQSQWHFLLRKVSSSLSLFVSSTVCSRFPLPKLRVSQDISKCHQLL